MATLKAILINCKLFWPNSCLVGFFEGSLKKSEIGIISDPLNCLVASNWLISHKSLKKAIWCQKILFTNFIAH